MSFDRMSRWLTHSPDSPAHTTIGADLLRVILGLLLIRQGAVFIGDMAAFSSSIEQTVVPFAPFLVAHLVVMAHVVGGLMLTAGLLTRLAAIAQVPVLVGALFLVPFGTGYFAEMSAPYTLTILTMTLATVALGSGRWAADHSLFGYSR